MKLKQLSQPKYLPFTPLNRNKLPTHCTYPATESKADTNNDNKIHIFYYNKIK